MTITFVAIVLFIVNASALQPAGQSAFTYLLYASGVVGILASAFGAYVTFRSPWTPLFSVGDWRLWLALLCGVSALVAIAIYAVSEYVRRRAPASPPLAPA